MSWKQVNPETQIRQFLLAFKDTETFRKALGELDEVTRKKVLSFHDGASCGDPVEKDGFQLPSGPAARHHFRLLDTVHSFYFKKGDSREEVHQESPAKIHAIIDY